MFDFCSLSLSPSVKTFSLSFHRGVVGSLLGPVRGTRAAPNPFKVKRPFVKENHYKNTFYTLLIILSLSFPVVFLIFFSFDVSFYLFYPALLELRCYIVCQNAIGETGLAVLTARSLSLSQEERGSYRDLQKLDILFKGDFSGLYILTYRLLRAAVDR